MVKVSLANSLLLINFNLLYLTFVININEVCKVKSDLNQDVELKLTSPYSYQMHYTTNSYKKKQHANRPEKSIRQRATSINNQYAN